MAIKPTDFITSRVIKGEECNMVSGWSQLGNMGLSNIFLIWIKVIDEDNVCT